jgi:Protein of unknown function (DUF2924)
MNIDHEVAVLQRTSTPDLKLKFAQLCGYATDCRNRTWLIRRIAWRLQASVEGGLSERARARAAELAVDAELRATAPTARKPRTKPQAAPPIRQESPGVAHEATVAQVPNVPDRRLPISGGVITRIYKGRSLQVKVLDQGFEFEGLVYKSLSALAKHITGSHCNGYLFFRLEREVQA